MTHARREPWGTTSRGEPVAIVTLEQGGLRARLATLGATLVSLELLEDAGAPVDLVLGFDRLADYESAENPYFGAIVGRVANRIARSRFTLDGREHVLSANEGPHHLHGGARGFDRRVWDVETEGASATFFLRSEDGDQGYPGRVRVRATYTLEGDRALRLELEAESDAPTPFDPTPHPYWNLAGGGTILDHVLEARAARRVVVDRELIPTGELRDVSGSPHEFRAGRALGSLAPGYDDCLVLEDGASPTPRLVARLAEPRSGRALELETTQPALQVYSGNQLSKLAPLLGKGGRAIPRFGGVCLEPQRFPDAVHHAHFPSIVLRPGERYRQVTRWRIRTR